MVILFFHPAAILMTQAGERVRVWLAESFSVPTGAQWISGYKTQHFCSELGGGGGDGGGETPGMFLEEPGATDHRRSPSSESTSFKRSLYHDRSRTSWTKLSKTTLTHIPRCEGEVWKPSHAEVIVLKCQYFTSLLLTTFLKEKSPPRDFSNPKLPLQSSHKALTPETPSINVK